MVTIDLNETATKYPADLSISTFHVNPFEGVLATDAGRGVGPFGSLTTTKCFDPNTIPSDLAGKKSIPTKDVSSNRGSPGDTAYVRVEESLY